MYVRKFLLPVTLLFCLTQTVISQTVLSGIIRDAKTREPLSAANIQIAGTYRGTIANEDGFFVITIPGTSADLIVSYIGYRTKSVAVSMAEVGQEIEILLEPIIFEGETIVVIAEDPAMGIMREVIKRKKLWYDKLKTYRGTAYSRMVLENDSGIVTLAESTSEIFWDKEKGNREVIKTKEQSSNLQESENFAFASYIPNFYDDDINIAGYSIIGPTHPDAMDYYQFKLEDITRLDKKKVFWIDVIPDSKLQPTFEGKLAVLDSAYALLEAELIPSDNVRFPMPIQSWDIYYTQQFRNYGREFWLPVDLRMTGSIKIGITGLQFPKIIFKRIASLSDYEVNVALPDSLFKKEDFLSVDSVALAETEHIRAIPLSRKEDEAYVKLDSTMTLEKAFKPTGFLASMLETTSDSDRDTTGNFLSIFSPSVWFNRVDGLNAGVDIDEPLSDNFSIRTGAAYKTGLQRGGYHARIRFRTGESLRWRFDVAYSSLSDLRYNSLTYSKTIASVLPLFALDDYFDYYWNKHFRLEAATRVGKINSDFALKFHIQQHTSLAKQTDYNLIWSNYIQRPNPEINEGTLRSIEFSYTYGEEFIPLGFVGQKRIAFSIEHSLSGDFDFTLFTLAADWRINTFLRRRLLPNALDIHLLLGTTAKGTLPLQRFGSIDAAFYQFAPFATFKSLLGRPYEGEKWAALFWEHNFRTVPFELLGFDFLVEHGIGLILYGAHGRTWIDQKRLRMLDHDFYYIDHIHHELGISINGILGLLRLDLTQRIDQPAFYISIGINRFF